MSIVSASSPVTHFGKVVCPARSIGRMAADMAVMQRLHKDSFPAGTRREIYVSLGLTQRGYQFFNATPGAEEQIAKILREAWLQPEIKPSEFSDYLPKWMRPACNKLFALLDKMTANL